MKKNLALRVFVVPHLWPQSFELVGFTITPIYYANIRTDDDELFGDIETGEMNVDNR